METDRADLPPPLPVPAQATDDRDRSAPPVDPETAPLVDPDDQAPERHPPPRRSRRRRILATAAVVSLVAASVVAVSVGWSAHAGLRRTDASLVSERSRLHQTLGSLAQAGASLATVSSQSTGAAATLAADARQLAGVQTQLAGAQAHEVSQGVNIADLDQCLAGVQMALNQVSLGEAAGAASTLHAVGAVCQSAEPAG